MTSAYRKHLEDRKRRTLIMTGAVVNSALSQTLLKIVYLDTDEGVSAFGDAIAHGWPALLDMGATYGTAFVDAARPDVGAARGEGGKLVTVSMVARLSDALGWMDRDKIHPSILKAIDANALDLLRGVLFIRFPANETGRTLGQHCINDEGEIQVFCYPEDDPVLSYLRNTHNIPYFDARSSNITGSPEEPFAPGAVDYACAIAAPVVAVSSLDALETQIIDQALHRHGLISQMRRKRFGSFPILRLSQSTIDATMPPFITIVRAGNTHPDTLTRLAKGCFPEARILYTEEKKADFRHEYESPFTEAHEIQRDLIRASRETFVDLGEETPS